MKIDELKKYVIHELEWLRYYALEADGKFIESRVELLIYQALKETQNRMGQEKFSFVYEVSPQVEGVTLPMKTDFTVYTKTGIWYWEHLGRIGNKKYESTWQEVKKPSYIKHKAFEKLIKKSSVDCFGSNSSLI